MKTFAVIALAAATIAVPSTLMGASPRTECFEHARAEYRAQKLECTALGSQGERDACVAEARTELRSSWDACPASTVQ